MPSIDPAWAVAVLLLWARLGALLTLSPMAQAVKAPPVFWVLFTLGFALEAGPEGAEASAEPDNAYARIELIQLRRRIAESVGNLPESERRVIVRHYFQQQPFEEIARGLSLTKGRISQIHHAALRRMRERLRELRNADVLG